MLNVVLITGARCQLPAWTSLSEPLERHSMRPVWTFCGSFADPTSELYWYRYESVQKEFSRVVDVYPRTGAPWSQGEFLGRLIQSFSSLWSADRPDLVFIQGDRVEAVAAAFAAKFCEVPIAHLYGGDVSGNIDNDFRAIITRFADIHFPSCTVTADVLRSERGRLVHADGDPVFDVINRIKGEPHHVRDRVLMLLHPEWPSDVSFEEQIHSVLEACLNFKDLKLLVIKGNTDAGHDVFRQAYHDLEIGMPGVVVRENVAFEVFLRLMRDSRVLVGNSSSFLSESASFRVPAVNVGGRQKGRLRGANVVDSLYDKVSITEAMDFVLHSEDWRSECMDGQNPYDDHEDMGNAERIAAHLEGFLRN